VIGRVQKDGAVIGRVQKDGAVIGRVQKDEVEEFPSKKEGQRGKRCFAMFSGV
jgi:hypothetical protein